MRGRRQRWWSALPSIALAALLAAQSDARSASLPAATHWADICFAAGEAAARRHGVPVPLMTAIALVESGRRQDGRHAPWPWALNVEGDGRYLPDRGALERAAVDLAARAASFDIGCFQVNHRWHGNAFASPADMADPARNAAYAARFLADLAVESGDWLTAAGHYHSRTPALAAAYRARVAATLERMGNPDLGETPDGSPTVRPAAARPGIGAPATAFASLYRDIDGAPGRVGGPVNRRIDGVLRRFTQSTGKAGTGASASTVPHLPNGRPVIELTGAAARSP